MLAREYPNLYIDGRWQEPDSNERFDVISPATGEKIGFVAAANPADIDRAVAAACPEGSILVVDLRYQKHGQLPELNSGRTLPHGVVFD